MYQIGNKRVGKISWDELAPRDTFYDLGWGYGLVRGNTLLVIDTTGARESVANHLRRHAIITCQADLDARLDDFVKGEERPGPRHNHPSSITPDTTVHGRLGWRNLNTLVHGRDFYPNFAIDFQALLKAYGLRVAVSPDNEVGVWPENDYSNMGPRSLLKLAVN